MTNSPLLNFFIVAMTLQSAVAIGGGKVGNGGHSVYCETPDPSEAFAPEKGHYNLDFLLTNNLPFAEFRPTLTSSESLELIQNRLRMIDDSLHKSFEEFVSQIYNHDYTKRYVWEKSPSGLHFVMNGPIVQRLATNCKSNSKINLIQVVIRLDQEVSGRPADRPLFKYVPSELKKLDDVGAIQISMMFVHEWLWDLTRNAEINRRVNRYLHSKEIDTLPPKDAIAQLKGMGLVFNTNPSHSSGGTHAEYPLEREEYFDSITKCSSRDQLTHSFINQFYSDPHDTFSRAIDFPMVVTSRSRTCDKNRNCGSWDYTYPFKFTDKPDQQSGLSERAGIFDRHLPMKFVAKFMRTMEKEYYFQLASGSMTLICRNEHEESLVTNYRRSITCTTAFTGRKLVPKGSRDNLRLSGWISEGCFHVKSKHFPHSERHGVDSIGQGEIAIYGELYP